MSPNTKYARWFKGMEGAIPEAAWEPTQYYTWLVRLWAAKGELKSRYMKVDQPTIDATMEMAIANKTVNNFITTNDSLSLTGKNIAKYIIAYKFYNRGKNEDLADNQLIPQLEKYLGELKIGISHSAAARMLQSAADNIPMLKAVNLALRDELEAFPSHIATAEAWSKLDLYEHTTNHIVRLTGRARSDGMVPSMQTFNQIVKDVQKIDKSITEKNVSDILSLIKDENQLELFMETFGTGEWPNRHRYLQEYDKHLRKLLEAPELIEPIVERAIAAEEEHLTWEGVVAEVAALIKVEKIPAA